MATAVLMLWRSRLAYELTYFWGFSGTLQAILTPDLEEPFSHPLYLSYFFTHGLIILGALYGTLVFRFRPSPRSMVRVYVITAIYCFVLILPLNYLIDANYVYMRYKPAGASLLDYLGFLALVHAVSGGSGLALLRGSLRALLRDGLLGQETRGPGQGLSKEKLEE